MLVPAIYYKEEILDEFKRLFYTKEAGYYMGCREHGLPNIADEDRNDLRQYAIVDSNNDLIGYFAYHVDFYNSCACGFGLISFSDTLEPIIVKDVLDEIDKILYDWKLHRVEWNMIGDNPIKKHYDKFCEEHNGHILKFRDVVKNEQGEYLCSYAYEIINE